MEPRTARRRVLRAMGAGLALLFLTLGLAVASAWAPERPVSALAARWAPPPSQFLEVDGLRVHLRDVGPRDDVAPLLLLHGTSASLHTWEGWVDRLASHHRVITLDLPGFGLTGPGPDGDGSIAATLAVLRGVLAKLGVTRCVVVGNSYGGRVAWELAAAAPELVSRLVLVDASGYPATSTSVPLGFRLAKVGWLRPALRRVLPRRVVEASVRNVYGDPSKVTDALVDRYYELQLREGNRAALGRRFEQVPAEGEVAKLRALPMPTLILWGGLDRLIPPEHAARFDADVPHSRVVTFPALGHVPHEEDPATTVASLEVFLAEPPPPVAP